MNLKLIWINILNPVFIKNEIKRKKIQIIIFFFINFGLTYSLGLLLYYNKFIDPENFASFMMILPLSSVAIAKFYTEGLNNDMYEFYSLIILFFLIYSLLIVLKLLNLINNNEFIIINLILTFISSLSIIIYSSNKKNLYPVKNIKLGSLLIIYFMISVIVPTSFILILQGAQPNYSGIIKFIFTPITLLTTIYIFLVKNMPGEVFYRIFFLINLVKSMCWSLWHLPLIFTLYTPEAPILGIILRSIHIVGISIFLGYLYIKTKNIWFCAIIHVLNNSAFLITNSKESTITYHDILIVSMVVLIFYVPFLFTKEYKNNLE
ncbi:putative membrane protein [Clostridioides difficile]|nr:putative membrane protein [Clostridioides difficile 630]CEJ96666.1 putative membrane protein [Clostridioides difficile]